MLGTILRTTACGAAVMFIGGVMGCQAQNSNGSTTTESLGNTGATNSAMVNQGRFPVPEYEQEAQPAYALTGEASSQDAWASMGHYYQVGNDRISFPAAP